MFYEEEGVILSKKVRFDQLEKYITPTVSRYKGDAYAHMTDLDAKLIYRDYKSIFDWKRDKSFELVKRQKTNIPYFLDPF